MKKLLTLMLCMMTFVVAFAQTESEHLTFKGVPIDGSLNSFVQKMKQKGFTYNDTYNNVALLEGTFSGYSGCRIFVTSTQKADVVCDVAVNFPYADSWNILYSNYSRLKEMLTTKYGEPSDCNETFDAYSQPVDDQMKILYVKSDKCKYETVYTISGKGFIKLIISHIRADYQDACYVSLIYIDYTNYMSNQSEDMDDL